MDGILEEPNRGYSFGAFQLDVDQGALLCHGKVIKLRPQSYAVLVYIVQHHGKLVEKEALLKAVWPNKVVGEDSLTQCMINIRRAIGDTTREMIRTVPRRGFIFDLPVKPLPTDSGKHEQHLIRGARLLALIVLALATAALLGKFALQFITPPEEARTPAQRSPPAPNSLAVLPLLDLSAQQDHQYLADGISEDILNALVENSELEVTARTSSFALRDKNIDVTAIARQLNVAFVVEGSVQVSGDRTRITAQLIEGKTGVHRWSHTYDRSMNEVFSAQRDIALSIAQALHALILRSEAVPAPITVSGEAYDRYLRAHFLFHRRNPGDLEMARNYFLQAIERQPDYANAWAGLAGSYDIELAGRMHPEPSLQQKLKQAAEKAVKLNPNLAEGWYRLSHYYQSVNDQPTAERYFRRAIDMQPQSPLLLSVAAGIKAREGDLEGAIDMQKHALKLDPLSSVNRGNLAVYLLGAGRYAAALAEGQLMLQMDPVARQPPDPTRGFSLILLERYGDALSIFLDWPPGPTKEASLAMVYYAKGQISAGDQAAARLRGYATPDAYLRMAELEAFCQNIDKSFVRLTQMRERLVNYPHRHPMRDQFFEAQLSPFLKPVRATPHWADWRAETLEFLKR